LIVQREEKAYSLGEGKITQNNIISSKILTTIYRASYESTTNIIFSD
jgi:hypothetical protein